MSLLRIYSFTVPTPDDFRDRRRPVGVPRKPFRLLLPYTEGLGGLFLPVVERGEVGSHLQSLVSVNEVRKSDG